ncbi:MAG: VOC family protein [Nitriliruptorales bacterium]
MERIDAEVGRLAGLGAENVQRFHLPERDEYWVVMRDPEGNELCLQQEALGGPR